MAKKKIKQSLTLGQKAAKSRKKKTAAKKAARKRKTAARKATQTKKWQKVFNSATQALEALDSGDENACRQHLAAIIKGASK